MRFQKISYSKKNHKERKKEEFKGKNHEFNRKKTKLIIDRRKDVKVSGYYYRTENCNLTDLKKRSQRETKTIMERKK